MAAATVLAVLIAAFSTVSPLHASFTAGAIWISYICTAGRNRLWQLRRQHAADLSRLRCLLIDLLPVAVADRMLKDSVKPPFELRRAAVLQVCISYIWVFSGRAAARAKYTHLDIKEFRRIQTKFRYNLDII